MLVTSYARHQFPLVVIKQAGIVTGTIFYLSTSFGGRSRLKRNQLLRLQVRAQKTRKEALYWLDVTMPAGGLGGAHAGLGRFP